MTSELPDFTHLPLSLYVRAHVHILRQLGFGVIALVLALLLGHHEILSAPLKILAAIGLVIGAANAANAAVKWRVLKKSNFTAIGRVTESAPLKDVTLYKVEFQDCEGRQRDCALLSQPWEKKIFKPGDKLKILYDPLNPHEIVNYSAYEAFGKPQ